jgi:hypothetical protein
MKWSVLLICICGLSVVADASSLTVIDNVLYGVTDLEVNGSYYDIAFGDTATASGALGIARLSVESSGPCVTHFTTPSCV